MTPLLILAFGVHPTSTVETDLLYAAVTKSVGSFVHGLGGNIEWWIVGRLRLGSMPATVLVTVALDHWGAHGPRISALISLILGIALMLSTTILLLKKPITRWAMHRSPEFGQDASRELTVTFGFILGVLVSISSIGAGALGAVVLSFLYPRLEVTKIVASDLAHAVPLALLAGLGHWWLGTVHFDILGSLLVGSIPGVIAGSFAARFVPRSVLSTILAVVLALVGAKMLV